MILTKRRFKDDHDDDSFVKLQQKRSDDFEGEGMGEGKGFASEMYRNTSEELFLKSLMDSSVPTMEMLGFKNISSSHPHNFRTDSEELFKSWLTNGEASQNR